MKEPILTLKNICYSYHSLEAETPALKNVSFHINEGEFVAIVGPSGCGKSTLLSIIAGLLRPVEGKITLHAPSSLPGNTKVGYMLQRDHLFEWRTIYENAILGLEIRKELTKANKEYVLKLMEDYDLIKFKDKKPSELSGGMKQRAALIRTLATNPQLLLLDEPFSALDYQTRLTVSADICRIIRQTKKTALLITHDLAEAISLADRIIVLSKRPATVTMEADIQLTIHEDGPLGVRNSPEFPHYFTMLWEALSYEDP